MRFFLIATAALCLTLQSGAADPSKADQPQPLNELSLQVAALQTLRQIELTPAQMEVLRKLADETAQEPARRQKGKGSAEFRQALINLREALVKGDADLSAGLQEKLDDLREAENLDEDEVEVTDTARRLAPDVLRLLSARQVAAYFTNSREEIADPLEEMLEALDKVRGLKEEEWKELRDTTTEEVGQLLGGLDTKKANLVADKVGQWLTVARKMKADEFKKQRADMANAARQFVGQVPPTIILHNLAERAVAELLSNPQLSAALEARLQKTTALPTR